MSTATKGQRSSQFKIKINVTNNVHLTSKLIMTYPNVVVGPAPGIDSINPPRSWYQLRITNTECNPELSLNLQVHICEFLHPSDSIPYSPSSTGTSSRTALLSNRSLEEIGYRLARLVIKPLHNGSYGFMLIYKTCFPSWYICFLIETCFDGSWAHFWRRKGFYRVVVLESSWQRCWIST